MVTDTQGKFVLNDLDPTLTFRLLVVAENHVPLDTGYLDPAKTLPSFNLRPSDLDKKDRRLILRGRVVDEEGQPVAQALVEPKGYRKGGTGRYGTLPGVDPLAVTNARGEFALLVTEPDAEYQVSVESRQHAPQVAKLRTAEDGRIQIGPGVNVSGRIVKDGKPVPGVGVGLVQQDRGITEFLGNLTIATDKDGTFFFQHVPPDQKLVLFGMMPSCKQYGALPVREMTSGPHGKVHELGDITLGEGHTLAGTVVTVDGSPLPPEAKVFLERPRAWDSQVADVAPDGKFLLEGVPDEGELHVTVYAKGFRLAPKNPSLEAVMKRELVGTLPQSVKDFKILIEPGTVQMPDFKKVSREEIQKTQGLRKSPLRGAP